MALSRLAALWRPHGSAGSGRQKLGARPQAAQQTIEGDPDPLEDGPTGEVTWRPDYLSSPGIIKGSGEPVREQVGIEPPGQPELTQPKA